MARLRQGRANTAAHFLRETVGRVRHAGATGQITMRADSGFYTHSPCRKAKVRFSITARQHPRLRSIIEAIPEAEWTPIPYWMEGAADVAETDYTPFESKPDAATVRLIVRRVKPTPGSQLALFTNYSYHAFITDRDLLEAYRRHAETRTPSETSSTRGAQPPPLGTLPRVTPPGWPDRLHNLVWTTRIGLGEQLATTKTLRRRFFSLAGRITRSASPPHFASAPALALGEPVQSRPGTIPRAASPVLTAPIRH